jgi:hypothetical protein
VHSTDGSAVVLCYKAVHSTDVSAVVLCYKAVHSTDGSAVVLCYKALCFHIETYNLFYCIQARTDLELLIPTGYIDLEDT